MKTSEVLKKARAVIEKPENWTKGHYARDADGRPVSPLHSSAICFCALGAIRRAALLSGDGSGYAAALHNASCIKHGADVHMVNDDDNTTHADVLAIFDEAISNAETSEQVA